ncbi:hypothetical protein, partial [Mesorhizobium australicum]|uniref:hypothetical protein n=1 Tax=Mesorhizobium australicum TaxID=536018 RepID=UPI00333B26FE
MARQRSGRPKPRNTHIASISVMAWKHESRHGWTFKNVWPPVGKRFISDGGWSASTYTACRLIAVAKMEIRRLRAS